MDEKKVSYKAYKYRIFPNGEQIHLLNMIFGCIRFIYNYYLGAQNAWYQTGLKFMSKTTLNNDCNQRLKEQFPWLKEVDKFAITNWKKYSAESHQEKHQN